MLMRSLMVAVLVVLWTGALPVRAGGGPEGLPDKCGWSQVMQAFFSAPPEQRAKLYARPDKQASVVSPAGHFRVHYDTTGAEAVYQPTVDVDPADGVPDYVNRCAEICDFSWATEVDGMGYLAPPFDGATGGDNRYDIYMHSWYGTWGTAWPESASDQYEGYSSLTSYIYLHPTYEGAGYPDPTVPLRITAPHEFMHAIQLTYNGYMTAWWWGEQQAVWMSEVVYDELNGYLLELRWFFSAPYRSLTTQDGAFEYAACVWPMYLGQRFGNDVMRQILDTSAHTTMIYAVGDVLAGHGSSLAEEFRTFTEWNYFAGSRDDGQHYEEGAYFPEVAVEAVCGTFPVLEAQTGHAPEALACNYVQFVPPGAQEDLLVAFHGDPGRSWGVTVVERTQAGQSTTYEVPVDAQAAALFEIPDFGSLDHVVMIPASLDTAGQSAPYTFSAALGGAAVDVAAFELREEQGDGDERPEAGERISLLVSLENRFADLDSVRAVLRSSSAGITLLDTVSFVGDLAYGDTVSCQTAFRFQVEGIDSASFVEFDIALASLSTGLEGLAELRTVVGSPPILVYDDDEGSSYECYYAGSLDELGAVYDVWDAARGAFLFAPQAAALHMSEFEAVVWYTGNSAGGGYLDDGEVALLEAYLGGGGTLLLSGQDIAEDLSSGTAVQQAFLQDYLHCAYGGKCTAHRVYGRDGDPVGSGLILATAGSGGAQNQTSQDVLLPSGPAVEGFSYQVGPVAGVHVRNGHRLVFLGFGVEGVSQLDQSYSSQSDVLGRALTWMLHPELVADGDLPGPGLALLRPSPNPFTEQTVVRALGSVPDETRLAVFDVAGRRVATLAAVPAGEGSLFTWDGRDGSGRPLSSGIYTLRFVGAAREAPTRVVLVR